MRLPTFFILGSAKCGTTALAQLLASHPDVFMSSPKEPHFFDAQYDKGLSAYLREHFAGWSGSGAAGEATPSYLTVPYVPLRLRNDAPDARLIVILRDPVYRAYSSWWMFHARGMEPLSFADAVRENEISLRSGPALLDEQQWRAHVMALREGGALHIRNYLDGGYYARHLRRYLDYFPREQIKVVFSHDLQRNPEATIRDIWRHVGVADDAEFVASGAVNEAVGSASRPLLAAARVTGAMRLRRALPEPLKAWIKRRLAMLGKPAQLDPVMRDRLREHFAPHTRELEELLGVDLAEWRA